MALTQEGAVVEQVAKLHPQTGGPRCWVQVANVASLPAESVAVAPDVVIRRAQVRELDSLRILLQDRFWPKVHLRNPFEIRAIATPIDPSGSYSISYEQLSEHRYFVLDSDDTNMPSYLLRMASALTGAELQLGPQVTYGAMFSVSSGVDTDRFLRDWYVLDDDFVSLNLSAIDELRDVFARFRALDEKDPLRQAVEMYIDLRRVPYSSPMRLLGYFAVLESMLTHDPHTAFDSLTHQMATKMVLLDGRSKLPVPYDEYFAGDRDRCKLWKGLYGLRSSIAHGARVEYGAGKLFKTQTEATTFVRLATKSVLRQCLEESKLMQDLAKV